MKIEAKLLIIFIIVLICLKCYHSNNRKEESIRTDTITITQIDTITIIKPKTVYKYIDRIVRDTLYNTDSVPVPINLPIETKVYEDTTYRAVVSGYRASLDSIYIFNKNQIHTINKITYKTKKWNFSPSVGIGYGMFGRRIDMYVGFSVNYNF
ncbi:DUF6808 domain-containing protein [uncultured Bacteroides sp.]|jgi:hypothetical protein|uniref:DUF6808 domain-containing protein n=1 Tax=uncultured Bacteroides sp. TaxID=162156 RepID=UPI0008218187|nr:hypothetical protein [uncultured Bacteroides sp.]SCH16002.1 Uncharacterised protein [uncultured Bacteroides sp.]